MPFGTVTYFRRPFFRRFFLAAFGRSTDRARHPPQSIPLRFLASIHNPVFTIHYSPIFRPHNALAQISEFPLPFPGHVI